MSSRSVFRLLTTLASLNFPLTDDRPAFGGETRHHLAEHYVRKLPNMLVPQLSLTTRECLALFLLLAHDAVFTDSEIEQDLASLRLKLAVLIPSPPGTILPVPSIPTLFTCSPTGSSCLKGHEAVLDVLFAGLAQCRVLQISYLAATRQSPKTFSVHPLRLLEHQGGLYLIVRMAKSDLIRAMDFERIRTARLLGTVFATPPDFNAEALLAATFNLDFDDPITATIRFLSAVAPYVRHRRWSRNQTIEDHPDGSITLTLTTSGTRDLIRWVLSFGSAAVVLSPSSLRDAVRDEALNLAAIYTGKA